MNIQTVSLRFRSVQCFVREIFEEMLYSKLEGYVWRDVSRPENDQKFVIEFSMKSLSSSSKGSETSI